MAFILNILFILFLCAVFAILYTVFGIVRTFYKASRKVKNFNRNANSGKGYSNGSGFRSYTWTNRSDNEEIIDRRTPNQANRKIFSENEGEYVDFEEEK